MDVINEPSKTPDRLQLRNHIFAARVNDNNLMETIRWLRSQASKVTIDNQHIAPEVDASELIEEYLASGLLLKGSFNKSLRAVDRILNPPRLSTYISLARATWEFEINEVPYPLDDAAPQTVPVEIESVKWRKQYQGLRFKVEGRPAALIRDCHLQLLSEDPTLSMLEEIFLIGANRVTTKSLEYIDRFAELKKLVVSDTLISPTAVQEFCTLKNLNVKKWYESPVGSLGS